MLIANYSCPRIVEERQGDLGGGGGGLRVRVRTPGGREKIALAVDWSCPRRFLRRQCQAKDCAKASISPPKWWTCEADDAPRGVRRTCVIRSIPESGPRESQRGFVPSLPAAVRGQIHCHSFFSAVASDNGYECERVCLSCRLKQLQDNWTIRSLTKFLPDFRV